MNKTEDRSSFDKTIDNSINIRKSRKSIPKNINKSLGRTKSKNTYKQTLTINVRCLILSIIGCQHSRDEALDCQDDLQEKAPSGRLAL